MPTELLSALLPPHFGTGEIAEYCLENTDSRTGPLQPDYLGRAFICHHGSQSKKGRAAQSGPVWGSSAADDNDVQQWKIFCLNKRTGEILWQITAYEGAPKAPRHPKATHANCTMATDGTNVVAFLVRKGCIATIWTASAVEKGLGHVAGQPDCLQRFSGAADVPCWIGVRQFADHLQATACSCNATC